MSLFHFFEKDSAFTLPTKAGKIAEKAVPCLLITCKFGQVVDVSRVGAAEQKQEDAGDKRFGYTGHPAFFRLARGWPDLAFLLPAWRAPSSLGAAGYSKSEWLSMRTITYRASS